MVRELFRRAQYNDRRDPHRLPTETTLMQYAATQRWTVGGLFASLFVFGMIGLGFVVIGSMAFDLFNHKEEPDVRLQAEEERLQRRIQHYAESYEQRQKQLERDGLIPKTVMEQQREAEQKRWHDAITNPVIRPGEIYKLDDLQNP